MKLKSFTLILLLIFSLFNLYAESNTMPILVSFYDGDTLIQSSYYQPYAIFDFPTDLIKDGYLFYGWEIQGKEIPSAQTNYFLPYSDEEYCFKAIWIKTNTDQLKIKYSPDGNNNCVYDCKDKTIQTLVIPSDVTCIDSNAFILCRSLTTVIIPDNVDTIKDNAFMACSSLKKIIIPNSVTEISLRAFSQCSSLESIILPDGLIRIGDIAFASCTSLTEINIPDSVESIGYSAFEGCESLESVVIPNSVTSIDRWTFANCTSLTEINIPDNVESIDHYAFYNCSSLESIYIDKDKDSISGNPWSAPNATIYWRGEY